MKKQSKPIASNGKTISFRIERITDVLFTHTSLEKRRVSYNPENIENLIGWLATVDKKSKEFKLLLTINFVYRIDEKNTVQIISYSNENVFLISNFKDIVVNTADERFGIEKNFVLNFLSISISTARGLLISKLGNTEYSKIILQAVNSEFLNTVYNDGIIKSIHI